MTNLVLLAKKVQKLAMPQHLTYIECDVMFGIITVKLVRHLKVLWQRKQNNNAIENLMSVYYCSHFYGFPFLFLNFEHKAQQSRCIIKC